MQAGKRRSGKTGISIIAIIVLLICGVIIYRTMGLEDTLDSKTAEYEELLGKIEEAEYETEEIKQEITYRQTDDYIEDRAREDLGLRYPDEIIFVPEDENN